MPGRRVSLPRRDSQSSQRHACVVYIHDHLSELNDNRFEEGSTAALDGERFAIDAAPSAEFDRFVHALRERDVGRTRWINIVGFSSDVTEAITEFYLSGHNCLSLKDCDIQTIGGPTRGSGNTKFFWIQSEFWSRGDRSRRWDSLRAVPIRIIVCMPNNKDAGTLITQFAAPLSRASEASDLLTGALLKGHCLEQHVLSCVWIMCSALIRAISEQLDFAFGILDPVDVLKNFQQMPRLADLPSIQRKSDRLARLHRYVLNLEETMEFIQSVKEVNTEELHASLEGDETQPSLPYDLPVVRIRARHEVNRTQSRLRHQQRLCQTFIQPFDNVTQMIISYSTAEIVERLDQSRNIGEQFAKIGIVIAAITGVVAPLSLITGYYGMNVQEFTSDASVPLFDVWKIGAPVLVITLVASGFMALWLGTGQIRSSNLKLAKGSA